MLKIKSNKRLFLKEGGWINKGEIKLVSAADAKLLLFLGDAILVEEAEEVVEPKPKKKGK